MKTILASLALATLALTACGGDDNKNNGASGVAKTKAISEYSADEATKMCDWAAKELGGYGTVPCDGSMTLIAGLTASQATCKAFFEGVPSTCTATTEQLEGCLQVVCSNMSSCMFMATCVPGMGDGGATDGSTGN